MYQDTHRTVSQKQVFIIFAIMAFILASLVPLAAAEEQADTQEAGGAAKTAEGAAHPVPAPGGFMAPTTFTIKVNGEKVNKGLSWILDKLDWEIPIEAEVRKGSFGAYAHLLAFKLDGELDVGPDDFGQRAQFRFQITPVIRSLIKNPIFDK